MLSISTIGASAGKTAQYYTESHAQTERYYDSKMEQGGVWVGGSAFGLNGQKVDGETFKSLLDGRDLQGNRLVPDKDGTRRVGYDLTFSADKSVSVLWARADNETREKLEKIFRTSIENSLKYIEKDILNECVRRGKDGVNRESAKELNFATFQHGSSRAGDPQLHMHCVLLNMAERHDGTWGAIDPKQAFKAQVLARKMFAAEFSTNLHRELGIGIKQTKDGFRIEGIPEEVIKHYSKRKQEIEERAQALGISSARGRERIALDTRADKQEVSHDERLSRWQRDMEERGFSWEAAQKECLSQSVRQTLDREKVVAQTLSHFTAHNSTFTEKALRQKLAENAVGAATIDELKKVFSHAVSNENVIRLQYDERNERRYTTIEILTQEKEMMATAEKLHRTRKHKVTSDSSAQVLDAASHMGMSLEQRQAAEFVIGSGSIALVQGVAGSGKSFTMKAVREIYEKEGFEVKGLAPTGKAAAELAKGSGIQSNTIDKYFYDKNKTGETFSSRDIVIVDEAGMVGSRKMAELVKDVEKSGAKLILVGDNKQLQPIDFGNPFKAFKEKLGAAEINTIRRQKETWQREAATDFREGRAQDGILKYKEYEALKISQTTVDVRRAVTEDFARDRKEHGGSQLILSSTNALTQSINEDVREKLKATGALSSKQEFKISVRDRHGNRAERAFCEGERIYFTKNNRAMQVQNGALGEIENIKKDKRGAHVIKVKCDNGHTVTFNTRDYDRFDYGYAVTIHKSQGATVDRTYVVATSNMDREAAYVAMTRHRESSQLYASQELFERMKIEGHGQEIASQTEAQQKTIAQRMANSFSRSNQKELSLDYVKEGQTEKRIEQSITQETQLLPTEAHRGAATKLVSRNLSRDEISNALCEIAVTPAGLDNPYRAYPMKQAEWQTQAVDVLKHGDFSEESLKALAQKIRSQDAGHAPILTQEEKEFLSTAKKKVTAAHEHSLKCNQEFEKQYVTEAQRNIAQKLKSAEPDYKEQAELVRQLYVEPSAVSPLMRRYMRSGSEVQNLAGTILKGEGLSPVRISELAKLVESKPVGHELDEKERLPIMKERSIKIENDFSNTLKIYEERAQRQKNEVVQERKVSKYFQNALDALEPQQKVTDELGQRRKAEFAQEFKTENHDKIAAFLEIDKWIKMSWNERADVVRMLAAQPRGVGKEFGEHHTELLSFQIKARDMLLAKDLSRDSCMKLINKVKETELGVAPTLKEHNDRFNAFSEKLTPYAEQAAQHSQKQEMKQQRAQEMDRGHSIGR